MNVQQLRKLLKPGVQNLEPPTNLNIGDTAFCNCWNSTLKKVNVFPAFACILSKKMGKEGTIYLIQTEDGESHNVNAVYFWTKEQVVRFFVAGPKGKKGARKYKRVMGKMRRIQPS